MGCRLGASVADPRRCDVTLTIGSAFSGIGGLDLGLERAGLGPVLWQVESDPYCREILATHWPRATRFEDVRRVGMPNRCKLTEVDVCEAVRRYDAGESLATIAVSFGVTRQAMWARLRVRTVMRPQRRHGEENHFSRGGDTADEKAHDAVEHAIRRGAMVRAATCEACGKIPPCFADGRSGMQAHHDDYNKPLAIRWLCQPCHHAWHKHHTAIRKEVPEELSAIDLICGGFP